MLGSIQVAALAPLLLQRGFGLRPEQVSAGLAVATAVQMAAFAPAGAAARRLGAPWVLRGGALLRAAGILLLLLALTVGAGWPAAGVAALASYGLVTVAWAPLSVASTSAISDAVPAPDAGAALGVAAAIADAARVVGSLASGLLVELLGYPGLLACSAGLVLLAALAPPWGPGPVGQRGPRRPGARPGDEERATPAGARPARG
jgi:MFS family permease